MVTDVQKVLCIKSFHLFKSNMHISLSKSNRDVVYPDFLSEWKVDIGNEELEF